MRNVAPLLLILALAACGNEQGSSAADTTTAPTSNSAPAEAPGALGLTERQLLDADLVDASGNELGDIEGLVRDSGGAVTQLLIEIEDSSPDRYVHIPLQGLEAFDNRGDRDIRTSMTREQLMALPEVRR